MKRIIIFCFVFFLCHSNSHAGKDTLVKQEIVFNCPHAEEVFFVWGVNGWQFQREDLWPEGTYKKNAFLSTQMQRKGDLFYISMFVKAGTKIDYCFWITKGPQGVPSDIWDVNAAPQKDYHSVAYNNNLIFIRSVVDVKPEVPPSILDFSGTLFLIFSVLAVTFFLIRKYYFKRSFTFFNAPMIIVSGFCIMILHLFLTRISLLPFAWEVYYSPENYLKKVILAGYYDYLFVLFISGVFFILAYLLRNRTKALKLVCSGFIFVVILSICCAILNIRVVEVLGKPFNYRWLYYSDFLNSADARSALKNNVSTTYFLNVFVIITGALLGFLFLKNSIQMLWHKVKFRKVFIVLFICANMFYLVYAGNNIDSLKISPDRLSNPIAEFTSSLNPFASTPELFTMEIPDSCKFVKPESVISSHKNPAIKNVLVVVLESTAAEYIQPYDKTFFATPVLASLLPQSLVFKNIYAHAPATNKSMFSLLTSNFPWLSYNSITNEYPSIKIPSISSELHNAGMRTAFLNSGDNHFQRGHDFLANRGFDRIGDRSSITCAEQFKIMDGQWDPLDGLDDACSGDAVLNWIDSAGAKPFFGMMWTFQTHYPYYFSGEEKKFPTSNKDLNRYLNAVAHTDQMIGALVQGLKKRNLFDSTLLVLVGDHGEAFGRHGQTTHASNIYEENLHIPCILIHPSFTYKEYNTIGGMVDVAPTIMDLLGKKAPGDWQGQSLLDDKRAERVCFFAPWSDYKFGIREGDHKFIYNATRDITEIYDLKNDPLETNNLSESVPAERFYYKLAGWVQFQEAYMKEKLKGLKQAS